MKKRKGGGFVKKQMIVWLALALLSGCSAPKTPPAPTMAPQQALTATPRQAAPPSPTPAPLGSAKTEILDWDEARIQNIKLACAAINGKTIGAGSEFSFNKLVGRRTADRGYQEAIVIVEGEHALGLGGGVCQVSGTVLQAAKAAGMQITERHDHQVDVQYLHPGEDAAVDYGNMDLRFVNTTPGTITVYAQAANGYVSVEIIAN